MARAASGVSNGPGLVTSVATTLVLGVAGLAFPRMLAWYRRSARRAVDRTRAPDFAFLRVFFLLTLRPRATEEGRGARQADGCASLAAFPAAEVKRAPLATAITNHTRPDRL